MHCLLRDKVIAGDYQTEFFEGAWYDYQRLIKTISLPIKISLSIVSKICT